MTEIIPYFAGLITLLFGVGFLLALKEMKKQKSWIIWCAAYGRPLHERIKTFFGLTGTQATITTTPILRFFAAATTAMVC